MAQKRYKFQVSSSSNCFLCFDSISMLNDKSSSLQNIFQYLKISLDKIKTLSTKPVKLLNKTDVRVSLCKECEKVFQEISKLYKIIELAQIKLDFNFEVIQKRLKSSNLSKREEYQTQLKESNEGLFIRHSNLVTELRDEILSKCDVKMPNHYPKVTLVKIADLVTTELGKNQLKDENQEPFCEESFPLSPAINPEELRSLTEEHASVLISEVRSIKQEDIDLGHVAAMNEPETDWNDDNLEDDEVSLAENPQECYQNRKITKERRQVPAQKYFSVKYSTCHICKEVQSTRGALLDHLRMHCKETPSTFKCLYQRQRFTERKWPCEVCKKSLSTKQKLADHLRIHFNEKPFKCSFCPKRYSSKDALHKHLVTHANSMEVVPPSLLKYQCTTCHKICSCKSHLDYHMSKHTGHRS